MGMIVSIKVGCWFIMLTQLLAIFYTKDDYKITAPTQRIQPKSCKYFNYDGKSHVLDVMKIIKVVW